MSDALDVHVVSVSIGALNNTFRPCFKVPTSFGGISVLGANAILATAGTVALNLVQLGTAGTAIGGTLATLGSAVFAVNTPQAMTVGTAFVAAGYWVGVAEANVGTTPTVTMVDIEFVMGK